MRIAEKKKSQITALYEQCSNLPADVRSCLENGYFTVTVPPPWNMSKSKDCAGGAGENQGMVKAVYWRGLLLF